MGAPLKLFLCTLNFTRKINLFLFLNETKFFMFVLLAQGCWDRYRKQFTWLSKIDVTPCPLNTGISNVHKTFRKRPGCLVNIFCTFILHPVPRGMVHVHRESVPWLTPSVIRLILTPCKIFNQYTFIKNNINYNTYAHIFQHSEYLTIRMLENTDQNNSECGYISRSDN